MRDYVSLARESLERFRSTEQMNNGHSHPLNGVARAVGPKAPLFEKEVAIVAVLRSMDGHIEQLVHVLQQLIKPTQGALPFDAALAEPETVAPVTETKAPITETEIPPPRPNPGVDLDQHIDTWGKDLKPRWRAPLKRANVLTLRQVTDMTDRQLRAVERIGTDGLEALKGILAPLGLETATDRLLDRVKHK